MCSIGQKMKGYTKTRNHTYIGETEIEREGEEAGEGRGDFMK